MHVNSPGTTMIGLQLSTILGTSCAYWTYRMLREKGLMSVLIWKKMGYEIPEYGIESLPMEDNSKLL